MTTIYVVTAGEYSDYHICAVYDTKEEAEYHAEHFDYKTGYGDARVEEYELNPYRQVIADRLNPFVVEMGRDGNTYHVGPCDVDDMGDATYLKPSDTVVAAVQKQTPNWHVNRRARLIGYTEAPLAGHFHVLATDEQHAVKIVNEKRTQLLAANRWPENIERITDDYMPGWGCYALEPAANG